MKKILLLKTVYLTIILFSFSFTAFSQFVWDTLPWKNYSDFRLQPLNKSYVNTGVLYDRIFPIAQLDERTGLLPNEDTTSSDHFKQSYYEMYNSIYNPSGIATPDNVESTLDTYPVYNGHPIGIMFINSIRLIPMPCRIIWWIPLPTGSLLMCPTAPVALILPILLL